MSDVAAPIASLDHRTEHDAACIERSLVDPAAFRALFARHHDAVHRYVSARIGPDAAQDVVSETFLQAFRGRSRFDAAKGVDALPWLLGIATRLVARARGAEARWHRLRATALQRGSGGAVWQQHGGSGEELERIDAMRRAPELLAALGTLRRGERDALCACVLGGLSYEQAASALGVPVGTIRSRVSRARERLRRELRRE